jgi:N-acetylneuraminate synthase
MVQVIAEIGINHDGSMGKALRMVKDAHKAGCRIVKFQCHIPDKEMIPNNIIPSNANESIWDMMKRCSFTEEQDLFIKDFTVGYGMKYLSTPFSIEAADRLERMNVSMYKIGSGECNNFPFIKHVVSFGKPIILSTGMNDFRTIDKAVELIGNQLYCMLHCTSMYPTPYKDVRLGAMLELKERYGKPVGLSDHSIGIYTSLAAVALGAQVVEKHFTSDKTWPGADVPISIDPDELRELVQGSKAIVQATGGHKEILPGERGTIDFAYASVVSTVSIKAGERFTKDNIWVKRPGGGIPASEYDKLIGRRAKVFIPKDTQIMPDSIKNDMDVLKANKEFIEKMTNTDITFRKDR